MKRPFGMLLCGFACMSAPYASASEQTPGSTVSEMWAAMSHPPGGHSDTATLRRIFHTDAVVFGDRHDSSHPLRRWNANDFLHGFDRVQNNGFYECEIYRTVHAHGRFATVYSVVESRYDPTAPVPNFVGVNSIQMHLEGAQWQVLSLYYTVEAPDLNVVLPGISGQCIS